jgi:hypothetical protein
MATMPGLSFFGKSPWAQRIRDYFCAANYLRRLTVARTRSRVRSGIFKGMRYVDQSVGSAYLPKLLGTYERELTPQFEEICARSPSLIINAGAGEGYYAVGLALRNPRVKIVAFEMNERARLLLAEMIRLNQVAERVEIREKCEPHDLQEALAAAPDAIVVCDVEGYEKWLLDPEVVPALKGATMIVETHDFKHPGVSDELEKRFAPTHRVTCIWQEPRSRAEFPWRTLGTMFMEKSHLDAAVGEERPVRMSWLWMTPRAGARP